MTIVRGKSMCHFGHHKSNMKHLGTKPGLPNERKSRQTDRQRARNAKKLKGTEFLIQIITGRCILISVC
jgi:hypothetical protein